MASPDRELEQQLMEAGNRLLQHTYSVDELLILLDQIENFLSRVEQSPPKSMQDALAPLLKALVEDELLRHSDFDVKVAVASCISEITRITAPDAPYNDDKMKDVFQLIVSSFENLSDKSSRSYNKRASILEIVAKVRSCVVMLDLECDGMIVEMFQHFLKSIRDYHPENVFMSMETIMTLVLEESEDISLELLTPLLASVKRNNEEVLPIARKLGEKVFENCAVKLKPDLTQTMKSLGVPLDDYSKVVASILEGTSGAVEHNDGNAFGEQLADERKLTKASSDEAAEADENKSTTASSDATAQVAKECVSAEARPEEVDPVVDRSPKAVMSNGITEAGNEGTSVDPKSLKEPEHDYLANKLLNVNLANKGVTDDSDAGKLVKSEVKPEQTAKRRGRKPNSSINSMEPFDSSRVVSEKEAEKLLDRRKSRSKDVCTSPREDLSVETTVPSENEKETGIQLSSSEALESDAVNVASPSPSGSLPDESHPKKTGRPKKKESLVQEVAPTVPSENEKVTGILIFSSKASESDVVNVASPSPSGSLPDESRPKKTGRPKKKEFVQEVALSVNDVSVKASEATCDSEVKPLRRSGKKATPGITKDDKILSGIETSKNEGGTSDLEPKPLRQSSKKGVAGDSEAKPLKQSGKKGVASDSEAKMQKQSIKKGDAISNIEEKSSLKKKENGKRRGRGKDTKEKDLTISSTNDDVKEMVSSPKSSTKLAKDEGCIEETPKIHSKRERTPGTGKDKVSETSEFGENLVGSKVKVWWPTDRRFYEGVVDSFDPAIKKHKVLYDDGEEETLHLRNERWELIQYDTVSDGEQATEDPRPDTSSEMHTKKKAKTSSGPPSVKQEKMQVSPKRDGAAVVSSSKLKGGGTATKSGCKSKDDVKVDSKSKDISLKGDTGSKSKDHSKKIGGGKSVDDAPPGSVIKSKDQVDSGTPKTTAKSKQDTPKTVVSKSSKGKSSQSGSKSNASFNGAGKVKKSKVKESKGRTPNPNTESDAKSGKKRRRGAKG